MQRSRKAQLASFTLVLIAVAVRCQQPVRIQSQQPQQPDPNVLTLHANARAVLLDVVVTDSHGRPVHNLKPQDFQILEDGHPQAVASLEEHKALTPAEIAAQPKLRDLGPNTFDNRKAPHTESTTTVFLLDALLSSPQAQMYTRSQLISWVEKMPPGNQVAIFQLDNSLHLIQGFTSDPAILKTAINDRYKPVLSSVPNGPGYVFAQRQMDVLTQAMQSLGSYLATRPGRKNLIWFTTHIPRYAYDSGTYVGGALHDSQSFLFDYSAATDALVLGQVSVYPIDTRGLETDPAFSASSNRGPTARSAARFETRQFYQHTDLDEVAEATGGRAFYNTNGIKDAVNEIIETGASYYTLSFYPTNKKWDNTFRTIKVDAAQAGLTLQYRHGYYAQAAEGPRPSAPRIGAPARIQLTSHNASTPDAFARSMHLGAIDPGQIIFAAHVDVDPALNKLPKDQPLPNGNHLEPRFRDKPFRTYKVTCVIPAGQIVMTPAEEDRHKGILEISILLVDNQDQLVNSIDTTLNLNLKPDNYALLTTKGLEMPIAIQVPEKGTYFLRIGVHDITSAHIGTVEVNTGNIKIGPLTP